MNVIILQLPDFPGKMCRHYFYSSILSEWWMNWLWASTLLRMYGFLLLPFSLIWREILQLPKYMKAFTALNSYDCVVKFLWSFMEAGILYKHQSYGANVWIHREIQFGLLASTSKLATDKESHSWHLPYIIIQRSIASLIYSLMWKTIKDKSPSCQIQVMHHSVLGSDSSETTQMSSPFHMLKL